MSEIERALEWLSSPVNDEFRKNHQFWTANVIRDVARLLASYAASEWVDVRERMPEPVIFGGDGQKGVSDDVLVLFPGGDCRYDIANFDHDARTWTLPNRGFAEPDCEPTHWQSITGLAEEK